MKKCLFVSVIAASVACACVIRLKAQTSSNIVYASQFPGADWCVKAVSADMALGATAGEIWVNQAAGTSSCGANLTLSANHILRFVQGGTYTLGAVEIRPVSGGGVVASSPGTQIALSSSGRPGSPIYMIHLIGAKNVIVEGLDLLGATTTSGADPSPLTDTGVYVDVNSTATIRHNIFENLNIGVNCYGCNDSSVEDNTFQNIVGAANASTGYGTLASNAGARVKILHNRYLGQSVMRHGIYDSSGHSFDDIEDNYVENTILDCITVYAVATQQQSVEIKIAHNELHTCAQRNVATAAGIGLYGYHARVTVTDNRINGSRGTCINEDGLLGDGSHRGEKNIISLNRCYEAAFHGISLGGVFDDQVTGNYVFNSGQQTPNTYSSIRLTAAALNGRAVPGAPANNHIRGNSLSGGQTAYAVDDQADHLGTVNEVTNNTATPGSRGSINNANGSLILSGNTIKSFDTPVAAP